MNIENKLWFHEDDLGQIELVANENFFITSQNSKELKKNAHKDFTENGFNAVYSRAQIIVPLKSKVISRADFYQVLKKESSVFYREIFKGYSSYEEKITDSEGFGYENYILIYTFNNGIIESTWIVFKKISETLNVYPMHLKNTLEIIGEKWNLVLVDWNQYITVDLSKIEQLTHYIDTL